MELGPKNNFSAQTKLNQTKRCLILTPTRGVIPRDYLPSTSGLKAPKGVGGGWPPRRASLGDWLVAKGQGGRPGA